MCVELPGTMPNTDQHSVNVLSFLFCVSCLQTNFKILTSTLKYSSSALKELSPKTISINFPLIAFRSQHKLLDHNRVCMSFMIIIKDNPTYLLLCPSSIQSSQTGNFVTNVSLIISDMVDFPSHSDLSCRS